MPRAKRPNKKNPNNQKTKKKFKKDTHHKRVIALREYINKYDNIMIFTYPNLRNNYFREISEDLKENTRFLIGKNNIVGMAIGRNKHEELRLNARKISERMVDNKGLLFTNLSMKKMFKVLEQKATIEFARAGTKATEDVHLEEGLRKDFCYTLESQFRKLGVPTELKKGIINVYKPYTVCKKGDILTSEQCKILRLLGEKIAESKFIPEYSLDKDGNFEDLGVSTSTKLLLKDKGFIPLQTDDAKESDEEMDVEDEES